MRERRRKFGPEFNEEAVKMVIDSPRPIAEVAREIPVNEGTLGNWVNRYRTKHAGQEPRGSGSLQPRRRRRRRTPRWLCPRSGSNRHWDPFKGPASADWATGASCAR